MSPSVSEQEFSSVINADFYRAYRLRAQIFPDRAKLH